MGNDGAAEDVAWAGPWLDAGTAGAAAHAIAASERDERRPRADAGRDRQRRRCWSSGAVLQ